MSWRNLAYGSQQAADAAPAVAPTKAVTKEAVVSQGERLRRLRTPTLAWLINRNVAIDSSGCIGRAQERRRQGVQDPGVPVQGAAAQVGHSQGHLPAHGRGTWLQCWAPWRLWVISRPSLGPDDGRASGPTSAQEPQSARGRRSVRLPGMAFSTVL